MAKSCEVHTGPICRGFCCGGRALSALHSLIDRFELGQGIIRGTAGSERSAMIYGEYFPNPGMFGDSTEAFASLSVFQAMAAEIVGTAMLVFTVFTVYILGPLLGGVAGAGIHALLAGLAQCPSGVEISDR